MISILIGLLVLVLIVSIAVWLVRLLPIEQPFANIIIAVIAIIALLILISNLGLVGGYGPLHLVR